jgi:hypothetical protein
MPPVDPRPCEHCGSETRNSRFCSNSCHLKGTQEIRSARTRKPRPLCPQCGVGSGMRGAQTCSRTCSAAMRRRNPDPCRRCSSQERFGRRRSGPYCSWDCFNEDRYERTGSFATWLVQWTSGLVSGTTGDGRPDHRVRQALVLLRGQRCEECGWNTVNPISGRVPLHVDHSTGDRRRNRPHEVRLLCPNCHALTPNYQHLNNPDVAPVRSRPSRRYRQTWLSSTPGGTTSP